jgi:hypothetical protein
MSTSSIDLSKAEVVAIKGFEGDDLEISVEQLETKIVPQSTAGFLD